ncbi:MAG: poly-beta-1,6 N-acetyl-D-glucosamine export porin PgaA [Candidimonas sp.]|nr:MAG: poly-beta-1,6 N-acetyl-D-glucosamine export porin PgaA [Candidimonas sp.]
MSFFPSRAVLAICAVLALPAASWAATGKNYDALIREARDGNYQPALSMLSQRLRDTPTDRRALADYILISDWAGHSREIVAAYEAAGSPRNLPAQPLADVARAYRNTQRWDEAIALYQSGERRYPGRNGFALGHVMTLADARQADAAVALGRKLVAREPANADSHLALAYAYQMGGQPYAALEQTTKAYNLAPARTYVARAYILALQRARLPQAALREADAHPGIVDPAQTRAIQADIAAQFTRLAAVPTRGEADRFKLADRALAMYDKLIPAWKALGPSARADVLRAEADRLQALHARRRMKDVVAGYEALVSQGVAVPDYVLSDVASAYLYLHHPAKAAALYRRALASPAGSGGAGGRLSDQTGLFYALTESGSFREANRELDAAVSAQPIWLYAKDDPLRMPNNLRLDADLTRALGYLYEGDSPRAQQRLDAMVNAAPGNTQLRAARAEVYRARELPRHAERDLKIAETQSPRSLGVEVGQAETALQLQEWHQARLLRDDVVTRAPEDQSVQRLAREWDVHNMSELQVTASRGISTNSPVVGSHDWNIDSVLYSPPIGENWRGFGGVGYSTGEFQGGNGYYRWMRGGAQWRGRDTTAQIEASGNSFGYGIRTGAALSGAVDLNDHWQVGGGAALLSRETPLRALMHDITSNSLNAYVRWRGDERREWTFSLTPSHFTDGNERLEASLSGRQRLYTTPRLKLDALFDFSASHNTLDNAPYFNPKSDLTVLPALQLTHVLRQRYESVWEQQVQLGAGAYSQQDHGTGGIFTVGYGQRFRYNRVLDTGFMVSGTSRPYDGQRERDYNIVVDMTYRF